MLTKSSIYVLYSAFSLGMTYTSPWYFSIVRDHPDFYVSKAIPESVRTHDQNLLKWKAFILFLRTKILKIDAWNLFPSPSHTRGL